MSVGTAGKWLTLGLLVAALGATGCKDDDDDDNGNGGPADSGGQDTGTPTQDAGNGKTDAGATDAGGGTDAAMDAGTIKCGTLTCAPYQASPLVPANAPGCVLDYNDAEACGLSTETLLMGAEPKFLLKDAPGVDSPSCAAFYDNLEPVPDGGVVDGGAKGNGKIDTTVMLPQIGALTLTYPGCCTPKGLCSGNTGMGVSMFGASNAGFGCMDPKVFFRSLPSDALRMIPCDPASGMLMYDAGAGDGGTTDGGSDAGASDAGADGGNG